MIVGVGVDVADVDRFARALAASPRLAGRLFTPAEREGDDGAPLPPASLAARFAAKEALAKALGAPAGLVWRDAEVVRGAGGRPSLAVRGSVAGRCAELGVGALHLSLSHDAGVAMALVVAEG